LASPTPQLQLPSCDSNWNWIEQAPAAMDYTSLGNDPDNPAEASPWGSSSPRADRGFTATDPRDGPSSPLPPHHQPSPYGMEGNAHAEPHFAPGSPDLSSRFQSAHIGDGGQTTESSPSHTRPEPPQQYGGHSHHQQPQSPTQPKPKSSAPGRYQPGARPQAKQQAQQYKLQAKITGLERTGKKDPILRFDVHVRQISS
jgi:hypothetical protein